MSMVFKKHTKTATAQSGWGGCLPGFSAFGTKQTTDILTSPIAATVGAVGGAQIGVAGLGAEEEGFDSGFYFQDYAVGSGVYIRNRIGWDVTDDLVCEGQAASGPLSTWSLRMLIVHYGLPAAGQGSVMNVHFAEGDPRAGGTDKFSWNCSGYASAPVYPWIQSMRSRLAIGGNPGGILAGTNGQYYGSVAYEQGYHGGYGGPVGLGAGIVYRMEMQVDEAREFPIVLRVYRVGETTPIASHCLRANSGVDVTMDNVYIGDDNTSGYQYQHNIGLVELHDDYDLGGQFTENPLSPTSATMEAVGAPHPPNPGGKFYVYENGGLTPISIAGLWNDTTEEIEEDADLDRVTAYSFAPPPYTKHHWWLPDFDSSGDNSLNYGDEAPSPRRLGLFYPSGTPPVEGWPLILWGHSGFFITGSYRDIPRDFVFWCLSRGYAVASVDYFKSSIVAAGFAYSGYKWPDHLLSWKQAAYWLHENSIQGDSTYPIKGTDQIWTGYSAGGGVALQAACSFELDDDGEGTSLALEDYNGLPFNHGKTYGQEIGCKAVYTWGAPTNLGWACLNDQTKGLYGLSTTKGIINEAALGFLGYNQGGTLDETELDPSNIINLMNLTWTEGGPLPIFGGIRGTSDFLVQEVHFAELMLGAWGHTSTYDSRNFKELTGIVHDNLMKSVDYNHFAEFLDRVNES